MDSAIVKAQAIDGECMACYPSSEVARSSELANTCWVRIGASVPHRTDHILTYQMPPTFKTKWYNSMALDEGSRVPTGLARCKNLLYRDEANHNGAERLCWVR